MKSKIDFSFLVKKIAANKHGFEGVAIGLFLSILSDYSPGLAAIAPEDESRMKLFELIASHPTSAETLLEIKIAHDKVDPDPDTAEGRKWMEEASNRLFLSLPKK